MQIKIMKMRKGNIESIMTAESFRCQLEKNDADLLISELSRYVRYLEGGITHHFTNLNINGRSVKCVPLWNINKNFKGLHALFY